MKDCKKMQTNKNKYTIYGTLKPYMYYLFKKAAEDYLELLQNSRTSHHLNFPKNYYLKQPLDKYGYILSYHPAIVKYPYHKMNGVILRLYTNYSYHHYLAHDLVAWILVDPDKSKFDQRLTNDLLKHDYILPKSDFDMHIGCILYQYQEELRQKLNHIRLNYKNIK